MKKLPLVSAIIPCRNEERFIAFCLDSIIKQNYPKDKLEILVVDGMSADKTKEIVGDFQMKSKDLDIKVFDNPKVITPAAMNIGIKNAKGEVIIKMDAHSVYEKNYILKCVSHLKETGADNVGGILKPIPFKKTLIAKAIALCLSHFFGAGSSYFRIGVKEPKEVDTVAFGCYHKKLFEEIGLYNEKMAKIEDLELNFRIKKRGGKIVLFPDIKAFYYPSSATLKDFFKHNFIDGTWSVFSLRFGFASKSLRHYLPLIFVLTLPLSIWFYIPASLFFSFEIALKEKDIRLFFIMPI